MDSRDNVFVQRITVKANELAEVAKELADLRNIYYHREYHSTGAHEIVDADLVDFGFTAAELASFITFCEQLDNLLNEAATTPANYLETVNVVRQL